MIHSYQKTWKALSRMASRWNGVRDKAPYRIKQQTARSYNVHWWLSHQRPVSGGFHCQAKWHHHLWGPCSLCFVNLQFDNGGGSSHPCPPLDCPKMWQSDHTCHHPNWFNQLATKSEQWNGKPWQECVNGRHPPSKTPVGLLPWTCRKRPSR